MTKNRDFSSGDPAPSDWPDSLSEFLGSSTHNFLLRIKPGDATKLQIPAGTDNDQVAIAINGRWRYITATVERASLGGIARSMDVFVTGSDNVFAPSGDGEIDSTVYAFGLAIVESAASPVGVALSRKVGTATWSGTAFTSVDVIVGAQAGAARHAATHAPGGSDPIDALKNPVPTQPTRVLGTIYQPNLTRPTLVVATVGIEVQADSDNAVVQAMVGSTSPPATEAAIASMFSQGLAGHPAGEIAVNVPITFLVPAGWYYELVSAFVVGTGVTGLFSVTEYPL